jgi:hypothetical protein
MDGSSSVPSALNHAEWALLAPLLPSPLSILLLDPNVVQYIPAPLLALFVLIYRFQRPHVSAATRAAA